MNYDRYLTSHHATRQEVTRPRGSELSIAPESSFYRLMRQKATNWPKSERFLSSRETQPATPETPDDDTRELSHEEKLKRSKSENLCFVEIPCKDWRSPVGDLRQLVLSLYVSQLHNVLRGVWYRNEWCGTAVAVGPYTYLTPRHVISKCVIGGIELHLPREKGSRKLSCSRQKSGSEMSDQPVRHVTKINSNIRPFHGLIDAALIYETPVHRTERTQKDESTMTDSANSDYRADKTNDRSLIRGFRFLRIQEGITLEDNDQILILWLQPSAQVCLPHSAPQKVDLGIDIGTTIRKRGKQSQRLGKSLPASTPESYDTELFDGKELVLCYTSGTLRGFHTQTMSFYVDGAETKPGASGGLAFLMRTSPPTLVPVGIHLGRNDDAMGSGRNMAEFHCLDHILRCMPHPFEILRSNDQRICKKWERNVRS